MQVINALKSRIVRLPVTAVADVVAGSLMIRGTTAETNLGTVCVNASTSAAGYIGILEEIHDVSVNGSALVAGAVHSAVIPGATGAAWFFPMGGNPDLFPARQISLTEGVTICKIPYVMTGLTGFTAATDTATVASLEDNIDTGFLYAVSGAAIGELRFIKTSAAGSCVTSVNFTTAAVAGLFVKILPLFHGLFVLTVGNTTTETSIDTTAAVGATRMIQLERHIIRNGCDEQMDPYSHGNLSKLNLLNQFGIYGTFGLDSTMFSPLS